MSKSYWTAKNKNKKKHTEICDKESTKNQYRIKKMVGEKDDSAGGTEKIQLYGMDIEGQRDCFES